MNKISNYDLLDLIGATSWSDEAKKSTINQYVIALIGYINEKLNEDSFGQNIEDEFKQLINNPNITEKQINEFFNNKSPEISQWFFIQTDEFKKMFVVSVYQEKINELNSLMNNTDTSNNLLIKWKQILESALKDDWERVRKLFGFD